jgi:type-F conjugative transfer system pilin assembly protein TrbC
MEEKKLLRTIILIIISFVASTAYAKDKNQFQGNIGNDMPVDSATMEWANDIANRDRSMTMSNFKEMMKQQGFDQNLRDSVLKPRPVLQIFVSTSMPRQLLKSYAREASRYGGVLVFRGLPQGSFIKLTDLVMDISDDKYPCAMQIDPESFKAFAIKTVPTIVLSKPVAMFDEQKQKGKFDKVQGNITIKGAIELFKSNGDLRSVARGMLR